MKDVKLGGVENEIDIKYRNRKQHACGLSYDHLLAPATNETLDCTKGEEFSEYSKDGSAPRVYDFHILVKTNKTVIE